MSAADDMPPDDFFGEMPEEDVENTVGEDRPLPRLRLVRKDDKPTIPSGTDIARQADQANRGPARRPGNVRPRRRADPHHRH